MDKPFISENARARARLRDVASRMTDEELTLPLHEGWTIASALAHLALWDRRTLLLLRKWKKTGAAESPIDFDILNDAILPLLSAIPPRAAADLAIDAAEEIDRELEQSSPEFIAEVEARCGKPRVYRANHRDMHLDQIEKALEEVKT